MQDPPRQADLLGECLVDVNRVEVSGRARVAHGHVRVGRDSELNRLSLLQAHPPLTICVHVPVHTVSSRWFLDTDSNTKKFMPRRSEMSLTDAVVVISSPATTSSPQTNSCPA